MLTALISCLALETSECVTCPSKPRLPDYSQERLLTGISGCPISIDTMHKYASQFGEHTVISVTSASSCTLQVPHPPTTTARAV